MSILELLSDFVKYFVMSTLVQRDYIAKRIGEGGDGMSFTEFSYTLLQGYDYLHLFDKYKCTLQVSGSDQWGNILSGVDLVRKVRGEEAHALTMPLIMNKATGKKFGKSEEGAVWLDEAKTSVFKFYQFWLNCDDEGVEDYLKIYTLIEKDELKELMEKFESDKASRTAQKYLAYEVTKLVHGEKRAESVKNISEVLFGEKQFSELSDKDIDELAKEIPTVKPQSVQSALVESGAVSSGTEARRLVAEGAISINGTKISQDSDITETSLIKKGKNTFSLVR
jgi:tyrosyl-tRNA synthetase